MKKNNLWDRYCKDVRKNLFCSRQSKQKILHALQCDIEDFFERFPDATEQDMIEHFGKPADFAKESLSSLEEEEIHKKVRKTKFIKRTVLIAILFICAVVLATAVWLIHENNRTVARYYTEEIVVYSDLDPSK